MPAIVSHGIEFANPKIAQVARRMAQAASLAVDKVAANAADPKQYPLPRDPKSLERVLQRRFNATLNGSQRQFAEARVGVQRGVERENPAALTVRVPGINAKSATPLLVQATQLPRQMRLTQAERSSLNTVVGSVLTNLPGVRESGAIDVFRGLGRPDFTIPTVNTKLDLQLRRVHCLDETNGLFGSEAGEDDIHLTGSVTDDSDNTTKIADLDVGEFDDGDLKVYTPARIIGTRNLDSKYPKAFVVIFVLAEVDMGGLSDFLDELLDSVEKPVKDAIIAAIGAGVGVSIGGPLGAAIGAAVALVVAYIFKWLKAAWGDEIFDPQTATLTLTSSADRFPNGRLDSDSYVVSFDGHGGEYSLTYSWRLTARPGRLVATRG